MIPDQYFSLCPVKFLELQSFNETAMFRQFKHFTFLLLAFGAFNLHAQYNFESKKAEKLYLKLEEYYEEADYEKILEAESDIESFFFAKQDTLTALMYSFLAESYYYGMDDVLKGIELYSREFELRRQLPETPDQDHVDLVYNLATLMDEAGQYTESEQLYLDLLDDLDKKKSEDYADVALGLLDHYTFTSEADKGLKFLKRSRSAFEKGSYEQAMSLKAEGDYLEIQGQFSKAIARYNDALEILDVTGYYPSREYVNILNSVALVHMNRSDLPKAESILNEAIQTLTRMGGDDEVELAGTQFNRAQVFFEYGLYDEALKDFFEIYEADKEVYGEESYFVAVTELVIGDIYFEQGNYTGALTYYNQAKSKFEAIGEESSINYGRVLSGLMRIHGKRGEFEEAQQYGEQVISFYTEFFGDDHHEYASALSNYAEIIQRKGNLDQAEDYLSQVNRIRAKRLGNKHPLYARSLRKLAILKWLKDDIGDALDLYDETFNNYFTQINTYFPILSEQEKSKFYYNTLRPTFEQFNSFVVEKNTDNKDLVGRMYDFQLATKGLILQATNKVRESILDSKDTTLINQYDEWIAQKELLAKLFSSSEIEAEERNAAIDSLTELTNNLEKQLSQSSNAFASAYSNQQVSWKAIQAKLRPGEAAVEIVRFRDFDPDSAGIYTDEVYYAALILTSETVENPEMVVMRNGALMEGKFLSNYRNAIKYQVNENYSYQLFWRPIGNRLRGIKKIYFSPDGVYNQISIYTLQNPASKKFTIDEFEIQLVNNTKDLLSYDFSAQSNFNNTAYLFGFPNYNLGALESQQSSSGTKTDLSDYSQAAAENRGTRGGGERGARGSRGNRGERGSGFQGSLPRGIRGNLLRYMRSNQTLALLPGTKKEVGLIDSLYKKSNFPPTVYLSNEALEESIKQVKAPQTLHIATHGFFLENEEGAEDADAYVENPLLRSGLVLAGANSYITTGSVDDAGTYEEDGILTAYEAMNLNLDNTELVVLSACETGLGEIKNGEGVFGLQRAFQVAGADAIIMSMWTVDDNATQELMTNFYEEWLKSGNKHKSFITAQKRLKEKRPAPYFWGAFVMIGN